MNGVVVQKMADTNFTDILNSIKIQSIETTLTPLIQQVSENFVLDFVSFFSDDTLSV